jgi:hypothetical protein
MRNIAGTFSKKLAERTINPKDLACVNWINTVFPRPKYNVDEKTEH